MAVLKQQGRIKPFYLVLLIILLSVGTGFYWLAGAINQQQDAIAHWVSDKLGHEVEINQAKLTWVNLSPKLELTAVKVLAEDGTIPLLTLDKLYFDLDLYDSVRYTDVRLDDITIKGLKIAVERNENGEIALQGLHHQGDSTPLFAELLVRSKSLNSIHLNAITIDFTDRQKKYLTGRYLMENTVLQHQLNKWQTNGAIRLPSTLGNRIQYSANWLLNEKQPELTTWRWTADINAMQLSPLQSDLVFKNAMVKQGHISAFVGGAGIGSRLNKVQLALDLTHSQLVNRDEIKNRAPVIIDQLSGEFEWQQHEQGWSLAADKLHIDMNDKIWPRTALLLKQKNNVLEAKGDFLRIEDVMDIVNLSVELPELISAQNPRGDIQNYQFTHSKALGIEEASFDLVDGELSPWQDYPGIDNLNAKIEMSGQSADVKIASQQVTISPATWLKDPVFLDEIAGEVLMQYGPGQQWQLQSNQLKVSNADLSMLLDGQIIKSTDGQIVNDLSLTLDNVAIARWKAYFPEKILNGDFKKWANNAFVAGHIKQGKVEIKGELAAFPYESEQDKLRGEFNMDMLAQGVQLHYAEGWPDLFEVTGRITGQGNNLNINSQQGSIAGFSFKDVNVDIAKLIESKPILTVKGQLAGTTQKALNFLNNSPLQKRFGSVATAVAAKGNSNINLGLRVPLADSINTDVTGNVSFLESTLYKKSLPELAVKQVTGRLDFDNKGVTSDKLKGQFLNQIIDVVVSPEQKGTAIMVNGALSSQQLRQTWPEVIPDFINGNTQYQGEIVVSERDIGDFYTDVTLTSDLKGMTISLPEPFNKSSNQLKQAKIVFNQSAKQPSYKLEYDDQVELQLTPSRQQQAFVELSSPELDIEQWLTWIGQNGPQGSSSFGDIVKLTINTDNLIGFAQQFSPARVTTERSNRAWTTQIVSPQMTGTLIIPESISNSNKVRVDLDTLALTLPNESTKSKVKQSTLWPAMTINIADLSIGDKTLGIFKLNAHTENKAWVIEQGQVNSPVFQATVSKGRWSKQPSGDKTELTIAANSSDFAGLLAKFGYQPTIDAEESELAIALSWPGEPFSISEQNLQGSLGFKLKKGKLNEVEPGAAGRVFGLMSIAAIPRRLALDFNELFGKGLNFKSIKGNFVIANGEATTDDLKLKSEVAEIVINGPINLVTQQYNQTVKVTPNVSSTLPLAGAVAFGPYGLGFGTAILLADKLAGKLFDKDIVNLVTYNYTLRGSWQDPELQSTGIALPK